MHHIAAAQRQFCGALIELAVRHDQGSITRVEMLIGLEEAVTVAREIRDALDTLASPA